MKNRFLIIASLVFATCIVSSTAFAQAYTAQKMSTSQVIKLAVFDQAPMSFDHPIVKTERILVRSRLDFEQTYDVDYETFLAELTKAYKKKKNIGKLDPNVYPNAKRPELRVVGMGKDPVRATLGAKDLYFRISFNLKSNAQGQAVVILNSAIRSLVFGGAIPVRAPFRPVGAKPVKFRWN